ncbi:MAG: type II toxin-antitoxin system RelE/ParE family toxin [Oscillospiraceae bacterium]|nr:type II toxin-antitoxin system RelE/ParE family toxin [Oscillospiraceae bacterium]
MLGEHVLFIGKINKKAAVAKRNEIMTALRSLSQMPQRFPFFESIYVTPNKYHRMVVEKWYLVLYQICDDTVYVEYILDCRQDYGWTIR